jgi:hypothetical protein
MNDDRHFRFLLLMKADLLRVLRGQFRLKLDADVTLSDATYDWHYGGFLLKIHNPDYPEVPLHSMAEVVLAEYQKVFVEQELGQEGYQK